MVISSGTTEIQPPLQLGRLSVSWPLWLDIHQEDEATWKASLMPEELTAFEYGYGLSRAEAVEDLASTVWEVRQHLVATPDSQLGPDLLIYKKTLLQYTQVNMTILVGICQVNAEGIDDTST